MGPCVLLEFPRKFALDGLLVFATAAAATAAIFGAKKRIKSGDVDGKPGGIAIGNIHGSTGL